MTKRIVRFSEDEFNYVAQGDLIVSVPKTGDYRSIRIEGDRKWIRPNWSLEQSIDNTIIGFTITEQSSQPAIYMNWNHKGKNHRCCVGRITDINEARDWVDRVNARYKE